MPSNASRHLEATMCVQYTQNFAEPMSGGVQSLGHGQTSWTA